MNKKNILIIGPNRESQGGVAAHIQKLKKLDIFKDAKILDVGSRGTNIKSSRSSYFKIFRSFLKLKKTTKHKRWHILINTSIYKGPFIKLLLILMFIDSRNTSRIDVFYHGGRFDNSFSSFRKRLPFLLKYLDKVDSHYFLSDVQEKGFIKQIGNYQTAIFNNYAEEDNILKRNSYSGAVLNFLFVGRIVPSKGIYEIIKAINILNTKNITNFHFNIVGDGPDFDAVSKLIESNNIAQHITMLGFKAGNDLIELYRSSDWFILPTYHMEGFPYVFIESMQAGVPILSTRNAALSRLIQPDYNGDFTEPKNPEMLANKLELIIKKKPNLTQNCYSFFKDNLSATEANKFYMKIVS